MINSVRKTTQDMGIEAVRSATALEEARRSRSLVAVYRDHFQVTLSKLKRGRAAELALEGMPQKGPPVGTRG